MSLKAETLKLVAPAQVPGADTSGLGLPAACAHPLAREIPGTQRQQAADAAAAVEHA